MSKIAAFDLGTNSIGWAVRDTELGTGADQIAYRGITTFDKGVGEDNGKEFSLAAQRTLARSARRRNQRRRWRKIDLLGLLITQHMCPLDKAELDEWKKPARKSDKKYPGSEAFKDWIRMDFNKDGIPDYINPYELRKEALIRDLQPEEFGRICYHLTQRRGYLSNRKSEGEKQPGLEQEPGKETPAYEEKAGKVASEIASFEARLQGRTIGEELAAELVAGGRARNRRGEFTRIHRLTLQNEFLRIADVQGIDPVVREKLRKVIFDQRPLRSQKATIGKCIYERKNPRCAISHPEFELFRMWQVINNIQYSDDAGKTWTSLSPQECLTARQKFFRKSSPSFDFSDLSKSLKKSKPERIFNYRENQNLAGCPTMATLVAIFGEEVTWELRQLALTRLTWEENEKGSLAVKYEGRQIDLYDLWQWLFGIETEKDERIVAKNAQTKLKLSEEKAMAFSKIRLAQGYANLSLKAIRKINRFLQAGERYDKAVFLANVPYICAQKGLSNRLDEISAAIEREMKNIQDQKDIVHIANVLIKRYNDLPHYQRFGKCDYVLDQKDFQEIETAIDDYFDKSKKATVSSFAKDTRKGKVGEVYQLALQKATGGDLSYAKPPRLEQRIKEAICRVLGLDLSDPILNKLYHPSEIESFAPAILIPAGTNQAEKLLNTPATASVRNPMAMRTLYELRKLVNYLLESGTIDEYTQIVVETARELNDANRRAAIRRFQHYRQTESAGYAKEIKKIFEEQGKADPANLDRYIERYRLRKEQPKHCCMYTGRTISDADLFDEVTTDIEHTIPRSLSFDDSLENKTVAFKYFNSAVKSKLLPSELANFNADTEEYTAILPRLEDWQKRIEELEGKVERARRRCRAAATKAAKDLAIQDRHYWNMHVQYWRNKLARFMVKEVTEGFKNSQLVDTQIISKYAVIYLKTLFRRVRSTKGAITDKIKRIWGLLDAGEIKDRSSHKHHAEDAIVLTLLVKERNKPDVYNLLAVSYREAEQYAWKEPVLPNPWGLDPAAFHSAIFTLTEHMIVRHVGRDKVKKQTKRKERRAGSSPIGDGQFRKGRGVRASLHMATYYGAIKVPEKENGMAKSGPDGKILLCKNKEGKDLLAFRTGFVFAGSTMQQITKEIPHIVDDRLRQLAEETGAETIQRQGYFEIPPSEQRKKKDPSAKPTKVYKVKVLTPNVQNPIKIKEHKDAVKDHKMWLYARNEENYIMALYEAGHNRDFELINTLDLAKLMGNRQGLYSLSKEKTIRNKQITLPIARRNEKDLVLKKGIKVLLFESSPGEVRADLSPQNVSDRLFKVQGLTVQPVDEYLYGIITLLHHLEARPTGQMKIQSGVYKFGDGKSYRKLNHNQFNGLIEGIDFHITPMGTIQLL